MCEITIWWNFVQVTLENRLMAGLKGFRMLLRRPHFFHEVTRCPKTAERLCLVIHKSTLKLLYNILKIRLQMLSTSMWIQHQKSDILKVRAPCAQ